jgi:hypothetical protein
LATPDAAATRAMTGDCAPPLVVDAAPAAGVVVAPAAAAAAATAAVMGVGTPRPTHVGLTVLAGATAPECVLLLLLLLLLVPTLSCVDELSALTGATRRNIACAPLMLGVAGADADVDAGVLVVESSIDMTNVARSASSNRRSYDIDTR